MNFGQALESLKENKKVRRIGWGKETWLSLTPGRVVEAKDFWSRQNQEFAQENEGFAEVLPYITVKTNDNKIVPWAVDQIDLLAEDWVIVVD
jgi:hypothetical protein